MLSCIRLINYIFIDELEIDFSNGLTVFTGETGAGKSIIIDAIGLIMGDKADTSFIKQNKEFCEITGIFNIDPKNIKTDIETCDNELIIRRRINQNGTNKIYINDQLTSISTIKAISENLIDMHGQHSHQLLLKNSEQMDILDRFGNLLDLREKIKILVEKKNNIIQELADIDKKKQESQEKFDLYSFQKKEIEDINLTIDEDERLEQEFKILSHSDKITRNLSEICAELNDDENSVFDKLSKISKNLDAVTEYKEDLNPLLIDFKNSENILHEIYSQISSLKNELNFDTNKLDEIGTRLEKLNKLKRKYGKTIQEILEYKDKITNDLNLLDDDSPYYTNLKKELSTTNKELTHLANTLSSSRKTVAKKFETLIKKELLDLNMQKVEIKINIEDKPNNEIKSTGKDVITFLVKTNAGAALAPLEKIASGGELSRIMLAIKSCFAGSDNIPTLIFDEIDTGLGGKTAFVVGKKLFALSKYHQVIAITHVPQVTVFGEHHKCVNKINQDNSTIITINDLKKDERITELGRMLGGNKITEITRKHAEELVMLANEEKK